MSADRLYRKIEALREHLSRLSAASQRINESLDFDAVLRAVMDSARPLTHAPCASIITLGASGLVEDNPVLGFDPGDIERLWQAPQGQAFFEYLNALPGPLRVGPLQEFTRSIGLEELRSPVALTAFMAAPILHRGVRSGHIYVGSDEPGREFAREDEETLVMFASQAALVIANARAYREERRARTDLEILVNTSPVGDAATDPRYIITSPWGRSPMKGRPFACRRGVHESRTCAEGERRTRKAALQDCSAPASPLRGGDFS